MLSSERVTFSDQPRLTFSEGNTAGIVKEAVPEIDRNKPLVYSFREAAIPPVIFDKIAQIFGPTLQPIEGQPQQEVAGYHLQMTPQEFVRIINLPIQVPNPERRLYAPASYEEKISHFNRLLVLIRNVFSNREKQSLGSVLVRYLGNEFKEKYQNYLVSYHTTMEKLIERYTSRVKFLGDEEIDHAMKTFSKANEYLDIVEDDLNFLAEVLPTISDLAEKDERVGEYVSEIKQVLLNVNETLYKISSQATFLRQQLERQSKTSAETDFLDQIVARAVPVIGSTDAVINYQPQKQKLAA